MKKSKIWKIIIVFIMLCFILFGVILGSLMYLFTEQPKQEDNNQKNLIDNQKEIQDQQLKNLLIETFSGKDNK